MQTSILLAALAATAAIAAPTQPKVEPVKRTFEVPANRPAIMDPEKALYHAQQKWELGLGLGLPVTETFTLSVGDIANTLTLGLPLIPTPDVFLHSSTHRGHKKPSSSVTTSTDDVSSTPAPSSTVPWATSPSTVSTDIASSTDSTITSSTAAPETTSDSSSDVPTCTTSTDDGGDSCSSSDSLTSSTASSTTTTTTTTHSIASSTSTDSSTSTESTSSLSSSSTLMTITTTSSSAPTSSSVTKTTSQTSTAAGDGEVEASPEANDSAYLSPVTIGGQTFNLDFDTGSADLWVFSTLLPADETNGHALYDSSKSSTYKSYQDGSWSISYGDGSQASGVVGFDVVNIGGVQVDQQAVELANSVSGQFKDDVASDGLVGLGFSNINTVKPTQQKTFFENVMPSLKLPVFTADLDADATGSYEFGEIDSSKYTGDIHYVDVDNSNGFWQFASSTFAAGDQSITCNNCAPLIADTGTTLILLRSDVLNGYYAQVDGAGTDSENPANGIVFPCSATLPDFKVGIGSNYVASIPGSDLVYAQVNSTHCAGALQETPSSELQILGDVFFKSYFAVFDGGAMRFGVATKSSSA